MSDDLSSREQGSQSPLSQAMREKVHPIAIIGASVFIIGFLALVIVKQQFPENWFVQKYLGGYWSVVAAFLFWCACMAGMAFAEWLINRGRATGQRDR